MRIGRVNSCELRSMLRTLAVAAVVATSGFAQAGNEWGASSSANATTLANSEIQNIPLPYVVTKTGESRPEDWGGYQGLYASNSRLTLVVYGFVFENYLQKLEQKPEFYKHLLSKTSMSVPDRRLAIQEFFAWWASAIADAERTNASGENAQISSEAILKKFGTPPHVASVVDSLAEKRIKFVSMMLRQGFADTTHVALASIRRAEGERDLAKRLPTLALAGALVARDEDNLAAAAAIANLLFQISEDTSVSEKLRVELRPHAMKLSLKVKEAAEDFGKIDILAPQNLMGGGFLFKAAGGLVARSAGWKYLTRAWSSTAVKATAASTGAHALLLGNMLAQPKASTAAELIQASKATAGRLTALETAKNVARVKPLKTSAVSIEAVYQQAHEILYGPATFESAKKYADFFANAERILPNVELRKFVSQEGAVRAYVQIRDTVIRRFDLYMKSRGLKVADAEAIAVLRGYVDLYLGPQDDNQTFALPAALSPRDPGNCVARSLNLTAFFYPAYKKYENPNFKFGLMMWMDHVEAVLYNKTTDWAFALYSGSFVGRDEGDREKMAILDPRVFAASYLYRARSRTLWQGQGVDLAPFDFYPRRRLEFVSAEIKTPLAYRANLLSDLELEPNKSPFVSALYVDPFAKDPNSDPLINRSAPKRQVSRAHIKAALESALKNDKGRAVVLSAGVRSAPSSAGGSLKPFETPLVGKEVGEVRGSRKASSFAVIADVDRIVLTMNHSALEHRTRTPYPTLASFESELLKRIRDFRAHPKWIRLINRGMTSIDEFNEDVSFSNGVADFATFYHAVISKETQLQPFRENSYRIELANRFEADGMADEMKHAEEAIVRLLSPIVSTRAGIKTYLEATNGLKGSDRVRQFHGLRAALVLAPQLGERLAKAAFKIEIVALTNKNEGQKKPEAPPASISKMGAAPVRVTIVNVPRVPRDSSEAETLRLDPISGFLFYHYADFQYWVTSTNDVVEQLSRPQFSNAALRFSEKFFEWMPAIDTDASWQGQMNYNWTGLGDLCIPASTVQSAFEEVTRICRFTDALAQGLRFDEIVYGLKPPKLDDVK